MPTQAGTHNTIASFGQSTDGGATWPAIAAEDNVLPGTAAHLDEFPSTFTPGTIGEMVRQVATAGHLEYRIANSDRPDAPVSVRGIGTHSAPDPTGLQEPQLIAELTGSTTTLYSNDLGGPVNSRWMWNGVMNTRPGGGAWTAANIDDLRLRLDANTVGVATTRPWTHNLLVEAAFPSSAIPVAVAAPQVQQPWQSLKVGDVLEVDHGSWSDTVTSRTWQWLRCPTADSCVPIPGATGQTYTLAVGDVGSTIRVAETASNVGGRQTVRSQPTQLVATDPTVVMATGFEGGAIVGSTDGQAPFGSPTFGSGTVRTGSRALSTTDAVAVDGMRYTVAAGQQAVTTRAYVRLPDNTPNSVTSLLAIDSSGPARSCDIDLQPGGSLTAVLFDGTDRDPQAGPSVQANRWYLLELRVVSSATTWVCDWSVDGVQYPASVWNFGATDTLDYVQVGADGDTDHVVHADDWMVSTTATDFPLGPGRTIALTPDGEGTHATAGSFASDAGALGASPQLRIDELAAWSITDWVSQTVTGATSYLEWTMSNPAERSSSARVVRSTVGFHSSSALGNDGRTKVVRAGDTDAAAPIVQTGNMSFTSIQWTGAIVPPPASGWTPSALDQLRMRTGYAVDVSPAPRWEAGLLEVEYRE